MPEKHAQIRKSIGEKVFKTGKAIHFEDERNDQIFASSIYPVFDAKGEKVINIAVFASNITDRKMDEIKIDQYQQRLKALTNELIISEEKQRREIANDLHDHVGQILASSRLQIAAIKETMGIKDILKKLNHISSGLHDAIGSTRNVIFELSPPQLNEMGLAAALSDWMHKELTQYDIKYEFTGDTSKLPVNNEVRYLLFRCIRELLLNVIKHAGATKVIVSFEKKNNIISISVHDNGSGYNYNPDLLRMKDTGFGLLSIYERIENIDGELLIDTAPGKGTNATLRLPIKKMKK
jgi:signal transduction histidine kinase